MKIKLTREELWYITLASWFMSWSQWFTNAIGIKSEWWYIYIYINNLEEYYHQKIKPKYDVEDWDLAIDWNLIKNIITKTKWDIEINSEWEEIIVKSEWVKYTLKKYYFSELMKKRDAWEYKINLDRNELIRWLDMQFAVPSKSMKFVLTGMSIIFRDNYIEFCGTNEFKLWSYRFNYDHNLDMQIVIPFWFINRIKNIVYSWTYNISLAVDGQKVFLKFVNDDNEIEISSILIHWQYPMYQSIFQNALKQWVKVKCEDMIDAQSNLFVLLWSEDYIDVYVSQWQIKFEYVWDKWDIEIIKEAKVDCADEVFTISQTFFHIIKILIDMKIKEVTISRNWRAIFFSCWLPQYNFMSSARDWMPQKPK
jgi:hypothetical protein